MEEWSGKKKTKWKNKTRKQKQKNHHTSIVIKEGKNNAFVRDSSDRLLSFDAMKWQNGSFAYIIISLVFHFLLSVLFLFCFRIWFFVVDLETGRNTLRPWAVSLTSKFQAFGFWIYVLVVWKKIYDSNTDWLMVNM